MATVRNTVQKNMVLNTVLSMHNHPTAEMVCNRVHENFPNISRATVYRNLNQLAEKNIVLRVEIPNGADRYDYNAENHYHIRCIKCGEVMDAQIPYMNELNTEIEKVNEIAIVAHHIVFDGVCSQCKK